MSNRFFILRTAFVSRVILFRPFFSSGKTFKIHVENAIENGRMRKKERKK